MATCSPVMTGEQTVHISAAQLYISVFQGYVFPQFGQTNVSAMAEVVVTGVKHTRM